MDEILIEKLRASRFQSKFKRKQRDEYAEVSKPRRKRVHA